MKNWQIILLSILAGVVLFALLYFNPVIPFFTGAMDMARHLKP